LVCSIEDDFAGRLLRWECVYQVQILFLQMQIKFQIYSMIDFINTNPLGLNDIERSCFHHKLVWIHPFLMEMVEQCD
jgi:hypothetical protein